MHIYSVTARMAIAALSSGLVHEFQLKRWEVQGAKPETNIMSGCKHRQIFPEAALDFTNMTHKHPKYFPCGTFRVAAEMSLYKCVCLFAMQLYTYFSCASETPSAHVRMTLCLAHLFCMQVMAAHPTAKSSLATSAAWVLDALFVVPLLLRTPTLLLTGPVAPSVTKTAFACIIMEPRTASAQQGTPADCLYLASSPII